VAAAVQAAAPDVPLHLFDLAVIAPGSRKNSLRERIRAFKPDVIAFSWRDVQVFSPQDLDGAMRHSFTFFYDPSPLRKARAAFGGLRDILFYRGALGESLSLISEACKTGPSALVAVGGPGIRIFGDLLRPHMPARVRLIAELPQLFPLLGRVAPGEDPFEPAPDLPALERVFPQWIEYKDSEIGVQTKRGCPHDCLYCLYGFLEGKEVRRRSPGLVVREVADYRRRWGAKSFWFTDAQLLSSPADEDHLTEILRGVLAESLDLSWSGYLRVNGLRPALARLMVQSGLGDVEIALNSGARSVLDELRMGFSAEEVLDGLAVLRSAGYKGRVKVDLSLNSPGETRETLLETIGVMERIRAIFGPDRVVPVVFFLAIQPHTDLEKKALAEGSLRQGYDPISVWPWDVRRLIYNPHPLGGMIGRSCALAFREKRAEWGDLVLENIGAALAAERRQAWSTPAF
jgi:hypothetical protein